MAELRALGAPLFCRSGNLLAVIILAMGVQRGTDSEKKLERVTKIVAVITIERIGAIVDGELSTETNVDAIAMRQVSHVTQRVAGHRKDPPMRGLVKD